MRGLRSKCRVAALLVLFLWVAIWGLYELLKPVPNGCIMTYMYPTYIPVPTPANVSSDKYGLFLYHEGWKTIDFGEHLKKIDGIPVLFIPGNGGSYKQVRSLAAESARAYQGGPLELTYYQEASVLPEKTGTDLLLEDLDNFALPSQFTRKLDWFAVDLEGEHSAMDGRILEEHTEYVVYAIHRILDQYRESREALSKEGVDISGSPPSSVILVGHSMGGFVARAAIVHPHLQKSAVETIITLSSPHQSPPIALQPSLGHYYSQVNAKWRKGYEIQTNNLGRIISGPKLSHIVTISIFGGIYDYQVRSKLASLNGIVPATNGFTIGSSGMKNVWLSMEHQSILWCNQLVVQVSHALLSLINSETGQPYPSVAQRILVLTKMLQSGIPHSLNWSRHAQPSDTSLVLPIKNVFHATEPLDQYSCPPSVHWSDDSLEKDLYIESTTVTVLAMDGKRRWLDIQKLGSKDKRHFIFVTNLAPCSGVRLHLWREKKKEASGDELPVSRRIIEVTSKMVNIPAGPAPRQIEPGSQTEQAPPSAFLHLRPDELHGFRYLTISVAPRPSVSGRPPPATSMAVGQFFNPKEGERIISATTLLHSAYVQEEILLKEDHPLVFNLSFSISLGLLPAVLSLKTIGCGIKTTAEQTGDNEQNRFCKLRCFPPIALAWDSMAGLHVIPNMYSETVIVDSSPAMFDSSPELEKTIVLLLVDPHCSYVMDISVSLTSAASRFCLSYSSQILGFMIAAVFFALMRQSHAWELDSSLPSILSALECNLRMPLHFLLFAVFPILISLPVVYLSRQQVPPILNYISVSLLCYLVANGAVMVLILSSQLVMYAAATIHVYVKRSWLAWEDYFQIAFVHQIIRLMSIIYSMKIVQILRGSPNFVVAFLAVPLVCLLHPALGLIVLIVFHACHCHAALCSYLTASLRSNAQRKEIFDSRTNGFNQLLPVDETCSTSPSAAKSYSDSQLEIFNYQHSVLILHLLATLMFLPSLVAWLQRIGMGQNFPWFIDSVLCIGVILHGLCGSRPDLNSVSLGSRDCEVGLSLIYLLAGYFTFLNALFFAPYRAFYAMAGIGALSGISKIIDRKNRERGDVRSRNKRRHSHKH